MKISKIKVLNELRLSNIINDIETGRLKIPRFQRKFVWERSKVVKLLDSIYQEFPIGSFFFWAAEKKYSKFFKDIAELDLPKPEKYSSLDFILDGQQRITSLYTVIKGKKIGSVDYGQIGFDLEKEKFTAKNRLYRPGDSVIPVCKILDNEDHLEIYDNLDAAKKKVFANCRNVFNNYPLSVITVSDKDLSEAIEIFERINQGGKRLSLFDLVVASTWGEDFDLRKKYEELEKYLINKGFGKINPEIVLHAAALIIKGYCRKTYLLQLSKEEIRDNWDDIEEAFKLTVDYMSENLGVKIYDFVPYPAMISLLTYLFYKIPGRSLNKNNAEYVHKWFWRAALGERYTRARETTMEEDRRNLFDKILQKIEPKINYPLSVTEEKIKIAKLGTKSAIRNAFFCMLALRQPRHFKNHNFITLDYGLCSQYNHKELHHIFPKAFLSSNNIQVQRQNLLLNFCFIPTELNKEILKQSPGKYFELYDKENPEFNEALESHLIPLGDFIKNNDYNEFIEKRAVLIMEEFERLTGSKISQVLGQDKNKAIDKIEDDIRNFIDLNMAGKYGSDYWKKLIPGDVQDNIKKRLKSNLRKNPNIDPISLTNKDRLNCCDIMDYFTIFIKNWSIFEEKFKSKYELEKKFNNFKTYRDIVRHNKAMDSVTKKEGEAAIEWFSLILEGTLKQKERSRKETGEDTLVFCEGRGVEAKGVYIDEVKLKVFKGSRAVKSIVPSFKNSSYNQLRDSLIKEKKLIDKVDFYIFIEDVEFNSPSAASSVILGRHSNGPIEWKIIEG